VPHDPHEEFEELCALSTTGELTMEEWLRLRDHLEHCARCRESQRQFERAVATAIPALAEENGADLGKGSTFSPWSLEAAEAALMESLRDEPSASKRKSITSSRPAYRRQARRYLLAATILASCSVAGYRIGVHHEHRRDSAVVLPVPDMPSILPHADPAATTVTPRNAGTPSNETESATLRNKIRLGQVELARLKDTQRQMADELAKRSSDLDQTLQERAELAERLTLAQASAEGLESKLDRLNGQKPQDTAESTSLKSQVNDLNAALKDKDREIAQEQELLQHDRDIRNLIGARNLYITEIYDVAKSGDTQKPFGRVFYTKDKSLIFYGYDLDEQRGVKRVNTFQAWGRSGSDHKRDVSLGLLYQDDANQKRWALKFNDTKTIAQIDAVFVTVEPEGGSTKPSGKPLLFTYLRLEPNHP